LTKCSACESEFLKKIAKNIRKDNITLSLIGNRKVGKTTYLSVLFYYIEEILTQHTDISYEYLDNKGFEYVFENVEKLREAKKIDATSPTFDTLLIVLFNNFFFDNNLVSFLDTPGELVEKEEALLNHNLSSKIYKSKNVFLFIDIEEFFKGNSLLYTGFMSKYLNIKEEKESYNKNIYLIFTKSDKVINHLYKYPIFEEYLSFCQDIKMKLNNENLEFFYDRIGFFSKEFKNILKSDVKKNFFNLLEKNFENVECFLVSALGNDEKFDKQKEFGVLNPLIYMMGKEYNSKLFVKLKNKFFGGK